VLSTPPLIIPNVLCKKSISGSASDKKGHLKNLPQKDFKLHTFNFFLGNHEALTIKETIILDVSCPHSLVHT